MIGTFVNTGAIIIGSCCGSLLKRGFIDRYKDSLTNTIGLVAVSLGLTMIVKNMTASTEPLLFIISMVAGCIIGSALDIHGRVGRLGERSGSSGNRMIEGVTTAVLLFCIGTLSILGPVESALHRDYSLLFTNAMLDLITSFILASTFGISIILAAPILFLWQGAIYLLTLLSGSFITDTMMVEISIVGGILIFSTGLNILGVLKIKTLDLLPALFIPVIWSIITG